MKHFYNFFSLKKSHFKSLRAIVVCLVLLGGITSTAKAQVSAYGFLQTSETYTPITGTVLAAATGNASATNLNSGVFPLTLPFPFTFNGTSHSAINVSTNGYITFGATAPSNTLAVPISSATAYDGAVSAFGRSLSSIFNISGVTGDISWSTEGVAPNRIVIIQWKNFRPASSTSTTAVYTFSFQIRLHETTNNVSIVYDAGSNLVGTVSSSTTAQIGLRGATNADFKNRLNPETVEFFNSTQGIANNSGQEYSTVNAIPGMPPAGLTYTFTPPTCLPPTNVVVNNITTTGADVVWASSSSSPTNGYEVYYTTTNTPPLNSVTSQHTGITGTSQTLSGLTPGTLYFVYVRSVCGTSDRSEWSLVASFPTVCLPITSMFEDFEGYDTGSIVPICWNRIVGTTGAQTISATTPASGIRNIYQYSSSTQNSTVVVLPEFSNVNAGTHWLRFKARVSSATGTLNVGYVTDPTNAGTFNTIQALSIANTTYNSTSEYTVIIPTTIPANARLAIMNTPDAKSYYWDDVYWEAKPSCLPPSSLTTTTLTASSGSVSWTASPSIPSNGYEYYYSTSSTDPIATTVPSGTVTAGVTTTDINGLTSNTTYYVWVRSVCNTSDKSGWIAAPSFKTLCAPVTSMFENFDSYATGSIVPDCWARIVSTGSQTINSTTPASGTRNIYQNSSTTQNPTIVVLPEFSNVNAGTHWLRFKARVSSVTGTLNVGYVTDITNAGTFNTIQSLSIANTTYNSTSEYTVAVPNTIPPNARLAIMNTADAKSYYWDDIYWEAIPTCFAPTATSISMITATTAEVTWVASTTPPANGYDVYYSTSSTPPVATTVPSVTGVSGLTTTIGSLTPATMYYVWVRSRCSTTDISDWSLQSVSFTTLCQPPVITSTTGATVCPNNPATLTAVSTGSLTWYDAATGGNSVGTGASFTTPALTNTTDYWVSASTPSTASVGPLNATIGAGGYSTLETYRTFFTANANLTIESVDVFPNTVGQTGSIEVYTAAGTLVQSVSYTTTSGGSTSVPQVVPLNISVPAGNYYMKMGSTSTSLYRNTAGATFPYSSPLISLTGQSFSGYPEYFYFFYNWKVVSACESPRTMVTATVDTNCLSTSEIDKRDAIKVYPNPFSEVISINKPELVKTIRVSDLSGKLVRTINQPETVLRLNDLSAGMYLLQLDMKDGSKQSIKIIKK